MVLRTVPQNEIKKIGGFLRSPNNVLQCTKFGQVASQTKKNQVIVLSQQEVRVCYGGHTITAGYR